ncbi:thiamine pyrophosphate-requiring protein [Amorphus orientalis]|uniref:Acetolactate synthase-1/2/3 large subunit n=1 Tax=Amorphus orientalis TaxID=649198 RepID=A0AAE3VQF9_9HYPH|nr:thiamine pyrophosphate-requiring protein [Amorphus orientalis]MDQ0316869.1 acetolactate synthase-1/2/3 large subunit [Amorphus orientalis]
MSEGRGLLAAEAYLRAMKRYGIDALYAVAGTDFPSVVEAYGRVGEQSDDLPRPLICPHENLAVAMAHGHALVTGRPQAAMVHVSVGTANMVCGAMNAARDNVPILLSAGRTPVTEQGPHGTRTRYIHWAQEMFDQAGVLREAVKWDYEIRYGEQVEDGLARALEVAMAPPPGPVYLSLPREMLAETVNPNRPDRRPTPASLPFPDPAAIDRLADRLRAADAPLIITANSGRDPATVPLLAELAERWAVPVVEFNPRSMNIAADHPMHLGFEPAGLVGGADLIVTIGVDVPWVPAVTKTRPTGAIVEIGLDPLHARYPMRSFNGEEAITAAPAQALAALIEALGPLGDAEPRIEARRARITEAHARTREAIAAEAAGDRMTAASASRALAELLPASATIVNEYSFKVAQAGLSRPGSYHGSTPAGGLGFGFGAALGIKNAGVPGPVVAMLGDGAYMFNNPSACHWAAEAHGLPILSVIFNNRRWGAVRNSTLAMYGQGAAAASDGMFMADLSPSIDHVMLARAHGAHAEATGDLAELPTLVDRALTALAGGKQALISLDLPE